MHNNKGVNHEYSDDINGTSMVNVAIVGFGEAGPVFGAALRRAGMTVSAYDKLQHDEARREAQIEKTLALDITPANTVTEAVADAELVISTVTASQALRAAGDAAPGLSEGAHWLDLNSVSPATKSAIADLVSAHGCTFTEAVAMDTVPSFGARVPILACGAHCSPWVDTLNQAGLNIRIVGDELGKASATKLIRSVLIKGFEALFAEAMEAAGGQDLQHEVLASLEATYPGLDWREVAGYQLSRASIHAARRASEMREAAGLLEQLGITPLMAAATAEKHQQLSDRAVGKHYQGTSVEDFLRAINACEHK